MKTALALALVGLLAQAQAALVNPYTGVPEDESAVKRKLALLKLQTQIQQQMVEMEKENFRLRNLDKILRAELKKQLRDLNSGDELAMLDALPKARDASPRPGSRRDRRAPDVPINLPAPVPAADIPSLSPPVETRLSAVIRKGGELAAVLTRGTESVTAKAGELAFGERVGEVTPDSVLLGNRRLTIGALLHANADAQPAGVGRGAGSRVGQGTAQAPVIQPALPDIPSLGRGNFQ